MHAVYNSIIPGDLRNSLREHEEAVVNIVLRVNTLSEARYDVLCVVKTMRTKKELPWD